MKNKKNYKIKSAQWNIVLFYNAFISLFLFVISMALETKSMLIIAHILLVFMIFTIFTGIIAIYYFCKSTKGD